MGARPRALHSPGGPVKRYPEVVTLQLVLNPRSGYPLCYVLATESGKELDRSINPTYLETKARRHGAQRVVFWTGLEVA
jgi:hypothetical protein